MSGFAPCVSRDVTAGYGSTFGYVDHDLFGLDALFEFTRLGMFATATECTGGFHYYLLRGVKVLCGAGGRGVEIQCKKRWVQHTNTHTKLCIVHN